MNLVRRSDENISAGFQIVQVYLRNLKISTQTQHSSEQLDREIQSNGEENGYRERHTHTHPFDEVGLFDEADGAPERVVDGSAVPLQLGGEASVHHSTTPCFLYYILQRRGNGLLQSHLSLATVSLQRITEIAE